VGRIGFTDNTASATGHLGAYGYGVGVEAGHVFTLFDSIRTAASVPLIGKASKMVTKAPPKPVGGYVVHLILSGDVNYNSFQGDGFTNSAGTVFGDSQTHTWSTKAMAQLYAGIIDGSLTWRPFVSADVDQQFGYSGKLEVISGPGGLGPDTLFFGAPQTFWSGRLGLEALNSNGWLLGVQGLYRQSAEFNDVGGQIYLRYFREPPPPL
jgi:hypothetical protein